MPSFFGSPSGYSTKNHRPQRRRTEEEAYPAILSTAKTRAYALGLNSLYLNTRGRESEGIVDPGDTAELKKEITRKLHQFVDKERNQPVVKTVYDGSELYAENTNDDAPDLVVGYHRGYRASWQTTLGSVPEKLIDINMNKWSGDHCISVDEVPGVLFTSFKTDNPPKSIHEVGEFLLEN